MLKSGYRWRLWDSCLFSYEGIFASASRLEQDGGFLAELSIEKLSSCPAAELVAVPLGFGFTGFR